MHDPGDSYPVRLAAYFFSPSKTLPRSILKIRLPVKNEYGS